MIPRTTHLLSALLAAFSAAVGPRALAQDPRAEQVETEAPPAADRFRVVASQRFGVKAESIQLGRIEGPILLMDGNLTLYVASALLELDGEKEVIALDLSGQPVDLREAYAANREFARTQHGKLGIDLARRIQLCGVDERLPVVAWLETPEALRELRPAYAQIVSDAAAAGVADREFVEFHYLEMTRETAKVIGSATTTAANRLRNAGFQVDGTGRFAPIVFLRVDKEELRALEDYPQVTGILWAGQRYRPRLEMAMKTLGAKQVQVASGGTKGEGARVAIIEDARVCESNYFLRVAGVQQATAPESAHATGVASCVASRANGDRGVAPLADIFSASSADYHPGSNNKSQFQGTVQAIDWSITKGASIINLSIGGTESSTNVVSALDRYIDYVTRHVARTFTVACGNNLYYAGDPGAGFNAIAVGAFDDMRNEAWSTDRMWAGSAYHNPGTGVETPQVVAPGVNVDMLHCGSPYWRYRGTGTSIAAPLVAGEAALVVSQEPSLAFWPEAMRAIIMATAWNNIRGAAALSARDGAGGVSAKAAWHVVSRPLGDSYRYGTLQASSFGPTGHVTVLQKFVHANDHVRVCISWDSDPNGGSTYANDALKADLDLYVYRPGGWLVAGSFSTIQPFEVVDFVAPNTGYYTIKIKRRRFEGSYEYYGVAMTTDEDY